MRSVDQAFCKSLYLSSIMFSCRYDWYQTQTHVIVTILLKNVKQEDMNIDIQEKSVSIVFSLWLKSLLGVVVKPLAYPEGHWCNPGLPQSV